MKIAMLGTRGIPAAYSGFETAVEHLAEEFAARGHEVVVYCRPHMVERRATHVGARLVHLPTVANKYLDTLVHTAVSTAHMATRDRPDVAIYFISGNAPVVPAARLAGIPTVFQIDGLDSQRAKWPAAAKRMLRLAERFAPSASTVTVTDSESVADSFEQTYGRRIAAIPYGASVPDPGDAGHLRELGLRSGEYVLFVGRLVPENNAHLLIEAHRRLAPDWPLVVVGDAPYAEEYIAGLRRDASSGVLFPGYVFGEGYRELLHNCGVMCVPTEVGGTHPVIVESLAAGAPLIVSDHAPNLEVVGDAARTFSLRDGAESLATVLGELITDPDERIALAARATRRAVERFSWGACADSYLRLCDRARERAGRPPTSAGG